MSVLFFSPKDYTYNRRVRFAGGDGGDSDLCNPVGNKNIPCSRSEIPIKTYDSGYALWRPVLNQMICDMRSDWSTSKQWIILHLNGLLTDSEFQQAPILCSSLSLYDLFIPWITMDMKSLQLIGLTYLCVRHIKNIWWHETLVCLPKRRVYDVHY